MYGYDYYGYESGIASILAISGTMKFISLALWILQIVGLWMIFKKAGEAGWKCLIPIYNDYIRCKVAKRTDIFWKVIFCGIGAIIAGIFIIVGMGNNSSTLMIIGMLMIVVFGIAEIVYGWKICKGLSVNFGEGTAFAVGLFFLGGIFTIILGLGNFQYVDAKKQEASEVQAKPIEEAPDQHETVEAEVVEPKAEEPGNEKPE